VSRINPSLFSSKSGEWETPSDLFLALDKEFNFTLDVCAHPHNAKCHRYFSPQDNGLEKQWGYGTCWMNPPYGREIKKWVQKACVSSMNGALVVALLPARTDTQWWHSFVMKAHEIRFIQGRVRFVGAPHPAPFPSCIVSL